MAQDKEVDALLKLENIIMSGDPRAKDISPEKQQQIKAKLDAYRQQGVVKPLGGESSAPKLTEAQSKAVGFYNNAVQANNDFERSFDNPATPDIEQAPPRSMIGQSMSENTPTLLNSLPSFIGNSDARQAADQAQLNFIMATLRQESGAAISMGEIQNQIRRYFPMPGDGPKVIEQKAEARRTAIESLRTVAGPGALEATAPQEKRDDKSAVVIGAGDPTATTDPTGSNETITPEAKEFQRQADELMAKGGSRADFDALAAKYGTKFDGEYGAQLDGALKARDAGQPVAGFRINPMQDRGPSVLGQMADTPVGAYFGKAADVLTGGFMDEAAPLLGGDTGQARLAMDAMSEKYPVASFAGEMTGGALIPFGRGAKTAQEVAKIGGITGAVYGFGSGDTLADRVSGAMLTGATGAGLGYGGGKLAERFAGRPMGKAIEPANAAGETGIDNYVQGSAQSIADAANRQNVRIMPADVGGTMTRKLTSATAQTPLGAGAIERGAQATVDDAESVASRLAGDAAGEDGYSVGRAAQRGMGDWVARSKARGGKLYEDISIAPDAVADLATTRDTLKSLNNKITSNPELAAQVADKKLAAYEQALASGNLSWNDLKQFRSLVGERMDGMVLQADTAQSDLKALYGALTQDMEATARAQGPKALDEFQRANRFWRARQDRLEKVATAILGKDGEKGAQAAFNQIQNWSTTRGESQRIGQMMRSLPKDEAETVSGAMIDLIGKASAGKQGAAGDTFSLDTFLTNWNKLDPRAKVALFNPSQRSALNDLATIAEGRKLAGKETNFSNTSGALSSMGTMGAVASSGAAMATGSPLLALMTAAPVAIQPIAGKLLSSPKVVRWILNAPAKKAALKAHIGKLGKMAGSSPAIAEELGTVERYLLSAMNDNAPTRAAASDQENEQRK